MTIYKCSSCGGTMTYDGDKGMLICEHCGNQVPVEESGNLKTERVENFKVYQCPSCGAEIMTDEYTAATFCSFCQSPTLVEDKISGEMAPSRIIAFRYGKDKAKEAYRSWVRKSRFVPSLFSKEGFVDKITGIYVPFWLYDYEVVGDVDADAQRIRSEVRGDVKYVHTDHFRVHRRVRMDFNGIPADASAQMEDGVMDRLEPFERGELKEFDMSYLSGFYAERYNYDSSQLRDRVEKRVRKYAKEGVMSTITGYSSKTVLHESYDLDAKRSEYVMMPVWVLNYRYNNKEFKFTMNGQTGKIIGQLPISPGKVMAAFGGLTAGIFLVLQVICRFL